MVAFCGCEVQLSAAKPELFILGHTIFGGLGYVLVPAMHYLGSGKDTSG